MNTPQFETPLSHVPAQEASAARTASQELPVSAIPELQENPQGFISKRFAQLANGVKKFADSFKTPDDYQGSSEYLAYNELSAPKKVAYGAYEFATLAPLRAVASIAIGGTMGVLSPKSEHKIDRRKNGLHNPVTRRQMKKSAIGTSLLSNDAHRKQQLKSRGF